MDNVENLGATGKLSWTNAMSTMMLHFFADLVASGTRTSSGFKKVHLNNCAKALNDHFKLTITGDQVSNHLKKWRKIWAKIEKLKKMSAAVWDEDFFTIRLDHEHYTDHIKDHKGDAKYLNTFIKHYYAMATIFGAGMATGKYANSGNGPLSVDVHDNEEDEAGNGSGVAGGNGATSEEVNMSTNIGESSGTKPPPKRAKVASNEDERLLSTLQVVLERFAVALEKASGGNDDLPQGLWDDLASLPGFDHEHLSHYYAHLVDNPQIARAFATLSLSNKLVWITRYVAINFG